MNRIARLLRRSPDLLRAVAGRAGMKVLPPMLARRYSQYPIGRGSYGWLEIVDDGRGGSFSMGAWCSVADGVTAILGNQHRPDWVTTYPFSIHEPKLTHIAGHPASRGDIVIGNDVWIATEAMILSGVTIGDGAVIAARAIVTRDVPPYAIVAGMPAKVIGMRFPDATIARLLALKWWDWEYERIVAAGPLMLSTDIDAFLDRAETGEL